LSLDPISTCLLKMPEPVSMFLLAATKAAAGHVAAAHTAGGYAASGYAASAATPHAASYLLAGVAVGTVLHSICKCLKRLVEGGVFSPRQADGFKARASHSDERTQREMLHDAEKLCSKWNI